MIGEGDCGEIGGMKIGRGNQSTTATGLVTVYCTVPAFKAFTREHRITSEKAVIFIIIVRTFNLTRLLSVCVLCYGMSLYYAMEYIP
jgi:hypothetical protein